MEDNKEKERIIKLALIQVGFKCDLVGFSYLAKAIEIVVSTPKKVYNLTKLFNEVAEFFDVKNPFRVEANIQNAITQAYNSKTLSGFNELYGMTIFQKYYKPTTAEVINLIAEYYSLGLYKNRKDSQSAM